MVSFFRIHILIILFFWQSLAWASSFDSTERTLFIDGDQSAKRWINSGASEEDSLKYIIQILKRSRIGSIVLARARKKANAQGHTILDVVGAGENSITDTTLVRKFSPSSPDQITLETNSKVYINKNHALRDAVLDLAHELTHYTFRRPFNPYKPGFILNDFIKSTIEERGGEVDAYMVECKVARELFFDFYHSSHCPKLEEESGKLSRSKTIDMFYRVGSFRGELEKLLLKYSKESISYLSDRPAIFISSAYGVPYPVAAYKEYSSIVKRVCDNDQKRLAIMSKKVGRSLASTSLVSSLSQMKKSYFKRCSRL